MKLNQVLLHFSFAGPVSNCFGFAALDNFLLLSFSMAMVQNVLLNSVLGGGGNEPMNGLLCHLLFIFTVEYIAQSYENINLNFENRVTILVCFSETHPKLIFSWMIKKKKLLSNGKEFRAKTPSFDSLVLKVFIHFLKISKIFTGKFLY